MDLEVIKEHLSTIFYKDAEYVSGALTWLISFVSLNIHLSNASHEFIIKFVSGMISLCFTAAAVLLTHFLKLYLERKKKK